MTRVRRYLPGALTVIVLMAAAFALAAFGSPVQGPEWKSLRPSVEYAVIDLGTQAGFGDNALHAVRIDPAGADLVAVFASQGDGRGHTAGEWCRKNDLAVAINLGMFQEDYKTNVGYARNATHLNNARWNTAYKSVLAFGPKKKGLPGAAIIDRDEAGASEALEVYETVIQNLRLIKGPGRNVWQVQNKSWSEAAVAMDRDGRILFLFCRSPLPMHEFNRRVLGLPLGIIRAMHVEGGPEASLSIHCGGVDLDLCGSYETGFMPDDSNTSQWPIPNVLGVLKNPSD